VKDPESVRYWKVLIDIDDDDVLEDVTDYIDNNNVSGTGKMEGAFNEAVSNQYRVVLRNSSQTFHEGDFAFAKCEIQAKVGTAEYITIFTGFVSEEGCSRNIGALSDDIVSITMFDKTKRFAMNRKTDRVVLANFKISDPSSPSTSIFHTLADMLGLDSADLDIAAGIDYTKPYLSLEDQNKVWFEMQALAQQYLGILTFRYDGKLRFQSRFETGYSEPSAEWTFSEDAHNIHAPLQMNGGKIVSNKVSTEFDVHEVLTQRTIFRNVEGYNVVTGRIAINVLPGEYWPGESSDNDVADLKYVEPDTGEEYPIGINIQTPTLGAADGGFDIESTGGVLTLESFNGTAGTNPSKTIQPPGSSQIILKNNTGSTITITKMILRGQPVRVKQRIRVEDLDGTITEDYEYREKSIDGRYAVSASQATITTQWWVEYGKVARKYIQLTTDWLPQVQEGALVNLVAPTYNINMTAQVISWTHPAANGSMRKQTTQLTLREWMSFTPAASPDSVLVTDQGKATAEGVDDATQLIEERPTYTELQDGYDEGGGTTTPSTPTILICEAVGKNAIFLMANMQLDLTNFKRFEWQGAADSGGSPDGNWYELEFDGTDWKDQADPFFTIMEAPVFSHTNIPYTGTADNPAGRKLHYRCRRVNKDDTKSSWSSTASTTTKIVDTGDIAAGTVYAAAMIASEINTWFLNATAAVTVGFAGSGSLSSPQDYDRRVVIDDDEINFQEYRNSAWFTYLKIGGSQSGRLLTILKNNGIYTDTQLPSFEILPLGTYYLFTFENQDLIDTKSKIEMTGLDSYTTGKFGSYAVYGTGTPPFVTYLALGQQADDIDTDFTFSGWVYIFGGTVGYRLFEWRGDANNYIRLEYNHSTNIFQATAGKGGTTSSSSTIAGAVSTWYHVALTYKSSSNVVTMVVNSTSVTFNPGGTWATIVAYAGVHLANNDGVGNIYSRYLDDFVFSPSDCMDVIDIKKHYTNNVAWVEDFTKNDILFYADGDIKLKMPNGRLLIEDETDEGSCGTLHLLDDANIPSSFVLAGGTATTFTDVNCSNYVPYGVKALLLFAELKFTGDGSSDYVYALIRKKGSSETSVPKLITNALNFTNLTSSNVTGESSMLIVPCDFEGKIEYKLNSSIGELNLQIKGYWI
jgi:hypothetical protein